MLRMCNGGEAGILLLFECGDRAYRCWSTSLFRSYKLCSNALKRMGETCRAARKFRSLCKNCKIGVVVNGDDGGYELEWWDEEVALDQGGWFGGVVCRSFL